jgi:hypothetical protein
MAGDFKSKKQRAAKVRASRELVAYGGVSFASSLSVGVGRREHGGRVARTIGSGGGIINNYPALTMSAKVCETTNMQSMQSQVSQLRQKVASVEESERLPGDLPVRRGWTVVFRV